MYRTKYFLIIIILFITIKLEAKEFYEFIGKSETYLTSQLGSPDIYKTVGTTKIYRYDISENESVTFSLKAGKVFMAIKSINTNSSEKAKKLTSIQILYYLSQGFFNQGSQSGLSILKKNNRVLSIGYMDNNDGSYSVLVSAYI